MSEFAKMSKAAKITQLEEPSLPSLSQIYCIKSTTASHGTVAEHKMEKKKNSFCKHPANAKVFSDHSFQNEQIKDF